MSDLFRDARHGYERMAKAIAAIRRRSKSLAARRSCVPTAPSMYWLTLMQRDGYLTRARGIARSTVLTPSGYTLAGVPPREPAPAGVVADRKTAGVRAAKERAPMT